MEQQQELDLDAVDKDGKQSLQTLMSFLFLEGLE
jgi:hypothetical protein